MATKTELQSLRDELRSEIKEIVTGIVAGIRDELRRDADEAKTKILDEAMSSLKKIQENQDPKTIEEKRQAKCDEKLAQAMKHVEAAEKELLEGEPGWPTFVVGILNSPPTRRFFPARDAHHATSKFFKRWGIKSMSQPELLVLEQMSREEYDAFLAEEEEKKRKDDELRAQMRRVQRMG